MFKYLSPLFLAAMVIVPMNAQQSVAKINASPGRTSTDPGHRWQADVYALLRELHHGATGIGNGAAAPALKIAPANLSLLSKNNGGVFPSGHVSAVLQFGTTNPAHGSADMPIWGDLFSTMGTDGRDQAKLRIRNISDYLKTLQK